MVVFKLTLLSCIFVVASFISGPVGLLPQINANTQTTSDFHAIVGNKSTSDLGSLNSTVPADNITTVTPVAPL